MTTLNDPSSSTNASEYQTKHLKFDWIVNFTESIISGSVVLRIRKVSPDQVHPLILDVNELTINAIKVGGQTASWKVEPNPTKELGARLEIEISAHEAEFDVEIHYQTSPTSTALQWLEPRLTADKRLPFMFSQCQAIHARSLFPCQDTPSVKASFDAVVHVPKDIVAVMGAVLTNKPSVSPHGDGWREFHFQQSIPIPSYLVTIACGDLVSERIGPRSSVWAEPSVVKKAAAEFSDTEKMIAAGEQLCGPYVWKVYDILVLPPTFPYGGMENPCLTFVSPTIIAGDHSMVNVIAHEIAHSWTGNLVTNSSWEHFWLNEGHTVYLERLILERLDGVKQRQLALAIGYAELINTCETLGKDNAFTKLIPDLHGVDPDVAYSRIPYEKGSLLLYLIERTVGKEKMMAWLKEYVKTFSGGALDTDTWKSFLSSQLGPELDGPTVDWDKWLYGLGMPPWEPKFEADDAIAECEKLIDLFSSDKLPHSNAESSALLNLWKKLSPIQRELALRRLNERPPLHQDNLRRIDAILELSKQHNAELRFEWSMMTIRAHYMPALESCLEFLNSQGRMRYTRPLYSALNKWMDVRQCVHENFKAQKPFMHRTTVMLVEKDLGLA